MKKVNLVLILLLLIKTTSSCNSDDHLNDSNALLPIKYTSSNTIETFEYDSQNRMIKSFVTDSIRSFDKIYIFNYENEDYITAQSSYISNDVNDNFSYTENYKFSYDNNLLTINILYQDSSGFSNLKDVVFDTSDKTRINSGVGIQIKYDSKGNITELIDENREIKIEYDNNKTIFSSLKSPLAPLYVIHKLGHFFRVNNPTKIDDNILGQQFLSYEFNSDNYPTKITTVGNDYIARSATVEYNKIKKLNERKNNK